MSNKESTLSIIKPDGVKGRHIGDIINRFEKAGLCVAGAKMVQLTEEQGAHFYAVHKERPFFSELVKFISSGPVMVLALEGPNAIQKNRELMGATNYKEAAPGTIRADFASGMTENVVHGSDGPDTAKEEIALFFSNEEIHACAL